MLDRCRTGHLEGMPFSASRREPGVVAGPAHGLGRLIVLVQPVAADEVATPHHHHGDQLLRVLDGEVLVEVDGEARTCRAGDVAIAPAGAVHTFRGLGAPALLEVIGEQRCRTFFVTADGEREVHRPGVPWDTDPPDG